MQWLCCCCLWFVRFVQLADCKLAVQTTARSSAVSKWWLVPADKGEGGSLWVALGGNARWCLLSFVLPRVEFLS
ncbi:hypothetical protein BRADI_3g29815v3 [Brachypodium distachyon]|uniref:Secreted protein n=1 Tax=Brachypodium distachyon TaxID=15368 RepID=A0A2K2D018_BRADI|nr:hypothetical protein BRADI_3g29815v3 [Brachypodium distachyon]